MKIGIFIVLAPADRLVLGFGVMLGDRVDLPRAAARPRDNGCSGGCSSSRRPPISLGHGMNDAQKTMGIIAVLLFTSGHLGRDFYVRSG